MSLQYKSEHTACRYISEGQSSLFNRYHFASQEPITPVKQNKSMLLYVIEGSIEITLESYSSVSVAAGNMIFILHDAEFNGKATADSYVITCTTPMSQFPLCARYDLLDLQQEMRSNNSGLLPTPRIFSNI